MREAEEPALRLECTLEENPNDSPMYACSTFYLNYLYIC